MESTESYVYKKTVDWSLLHDGLAIPLENQIVFGRNMGKFLSRGEAKGINLYLNGKSYKAEIRNLNISARHNRRTDILQIRYSANSALAVELRMQFRKSYNFLTDQRLNRPEGEKIHIKVPEDCREYLAIYTTEFEDTYLLETILADDMSYFKEDLKNKTERAVEASFNYHEVDEQSSMYVRESFVKVRKLNRKIGENLKLLYNNRCQICGVSIGDKYDLHISEAHHIEYFVKSLNNDSNNQLIVCPNHHRIIHDADPVFDKKRCIYIYPNGLEERLALNLHIR